MEPAVTDWTADDWVLGPQPVRDWERCTSCGHMGADCDCFCCWPDQPDDPDEEEVADGD